MRSTIRMPGGTGFRTPPCELLYSLCEGGADTAGEICAVWHYPPQTVNSVLKIWSGRGFIALEPVQGNRKNKRIVLTEQGTALAERVIRPLILAEQRALHGMEERNVTAFWT